LLPPIFVCFVPYFAQPRLVFIFVTHLVSFVSKKLEQKKKTMITKRQFLLFSFVQSTAVFTNFASHYKAPQMDRLSVENPIYSTLSYAEGASLVKHF